MPVIGYLDPRSPDAISERLRAFRQGLKDTGYVVGENVAIEYRWAENQLDRLPMLAADLVSRQIAENHSCRGKAPAVARWTATQGKCEPGRPNRTAAMVSAEGQS
jgi:putative tryptophan/tyrosine transport system substrate-binding protein